MTVCPGESALSWRRHVAGSLPALAVLAALLTATALTPALAQSGPLRLTPSRAEPVVSPALGEPEQAAPATPLETPAPPPAAATPLAPVSEAAPEPAPESMIESSALPPVDVDGVGLQDESRARLPADLWQGSNRPAIERLIALLPAPNLSPAARDLAERILTVSAMPPEDGGAKASFVAIRAARLMAMGNVTAATNLARAVPRRDSDETLSRILLDAALIAGDTDEACRLARGQISRFDALYRQKAIIFCQAIAGEHDRAQLGLSMLREQQADDDPLFVRLIFAMGADKPQPAGEVPGALTPLHVAMLRAAHQPVPEAAIERAAPALLRAIATSPDMPPPTRLAAALRAEAAGALPTDALIEILAAAAFKPDELEGALTLAEKAPAPRAQAALYRAAEAQSVEIARAEALQRAYRIARARGFYPAVARATAPLLRRIEPGAALGWFAADAGRALLQAGHRDEAQRWFALAHDIAANGDQAEILLWPLLRLAGAEVPALDAKALARWRAAQEKRDPAEMPKRAALLGALLAALGDGADSALAGALLSGDLAPENVPMPHRALWAGREAAAASGRVGETALFVLAALGPEGPGAWTPHTQAALIRDLRAVGLQEDARALALESALAAGL